MSVDDINKLRTNLREWTDDTIETWVSRYDNRPYPRVYDRAQETMRHALQRERKRRYNIAWNKRKREG